MLLIVDILSSIKNVHANITYMTTLVDVLTFIGMIYTTSDSLKTTKVIIFGIMGKICTAGYD